MVKTGIHGREGNRGRQRGRKITVPTNNLGRISGSQACFWFRTPVAELGFMAVSRQPPPFLWLPQVSKNWGMVELALASVANKMSLPCNEHPDEKEDK